MDCQIINSGSFGGELILLITPPSQLIESIISSGMRVRRSGNNYFFLLIDIKDCRNNRLRQKLIDLVEEDLDYEISIPV